MRDQPALTFFLSTFKPLLSGFFYARLICHPPRKAPMTPIEQFSQMSPTLVVAARALRESFPTEHQAPSRFNLFVALASEEAAHHQFDVTALIPFFKHFFNTFDTNQ